MVHEHQKMMNKILADGIEITHVHSVALQQKKKWSQEVTK